MQNPKTKRVNPADNFIFQFDISNMKYHLWYDDDEDVQDDVYLKPN